jgi:hypothetical protein
VGLGEPDDQVFVIAGPRGHTRSRAEIREQAHRSREEARDNVVSVVPQDHRAFHELGAELFEVVLRFDAANELMGVRGTGDLADDMGGFGKAVAPGFGREGELGPGELDGPIREPHVERYLWQEDSVLHGAESLPVSLSLEKPYRPRVTVKTVSLPFAPTFEALVAEVAKSLPAERIAELHRAFEKRTGAFGPDDRWFESRSRAFWDDTMTRQPAAREVLDRATPSEPWALALSRSHRGLFRSSTDERGLVLSDLWSGIELVVDELDDASRDALRSPSGPFDGTVIALRDPIRLALLPGAIFHPEDAEPAIADVVAIARTRGLSAGATLDALLRMELSFQVLSRVKPSYAYRGEALGA